MKFKKKHMKLIEQFFALSTADKAITLALVVVIVVVIL